jgi:uncharacterized GH25 family protein
MKRWDIVLLLVVLTSGTARAHFFWVIPTAKGDSAAVVFSDSPQLDKGEGLPPASIKTVTVSLRHADGRVESAKGIADKDAYRVACPGTGLRTLAVVQNHMAGFKSGLLLTRVSTAHLSDPEGKVRRSEEAPAWENLGLEILPRPDKSPAVFQVVYRGKPVEKIDVEIYSPGDLDTDNLPHVTSDRDGLVNLKVLKAGRYGLYVDREFDEKGMHDGKPFTKRSYTSTLVIEVPAPQDK